MGDHEKVQSLFAFTARYNGPDSSRGAATDDMDGKKKHDAILDIEYTYTKVSTQKGDNTRLKRWYDYCTDRGFPDCHPYPAHRVYTYLEMDLDRNVVKGKSACSEQICCGPWVPVWPLSMQPVEPALLQQASSCCPHQ